MKERLLKNTQISHVQQFKDYARDLNQLIENLEQMGTVQSLLCHSMGCAVALDYLEYYDSPVKSVIITSPMLKIKTYPYPNSIAYALSSTFILAGKGPEYTIGQGDYYPTHEVEKSIVTQSQARLNYSNKLVELFPKSKIGGVSNKWINQSLKATFHIRHTHDKLTIPVLMLISGNDFLLKPEASLEWCQKQSECRFHTYPYAKHEIWHEIDVIRNHALKQVYNFLQNY